MKRLAVLLLALGACSKPTAPPRPVVLATTTSFQDSGLLDALVARFRSAGGPPVKAVAVGTGEALAMASKGDADVVVVHAPQAELKFMDEGHGRNRRALWHNDFVIVGPRSDPAGLRAYKGKLAEGLQALARSNAAWISRGDQSGTHLKEKQLLAAANVEPWPAFGSAGQGMGETLRIASEKQAYTLADRGTFLKLKGTLALDVVMEGEPPLMNPYHVIEVDPAKHPKVNAEGAHRFAEFLVAPETQRFVSTFGVERYGQPLFYPDAAAAPAADPR